MTLNIIQPLIDAAPDSIRSEDHIGCMHLHHLCLNGEEMDETAALGILKLLIEKHPEQSSMPIITEVFQFSSQVGGENLSSVD